MTSRFFSSSLACALALSFVATPSIAQAQAAAPATSTPAPAPAPAASTAPAPTAPADTATDHPSTYTIAQGDSLWSIAHKYGTTVVKLRKLNDLKKGALLHPGQVIKLPPADSDATAK